MQKPADVDTYIAAHPQWEAQLVLLREVALGAGLEETIKWGAPVYCAGGKNIAGLMAFKDYAGIWFFQGALLDDPRGVLVNAQEGKTKALRQWRFVSGERVVKKHVREYLAEAIQNHREGRVIKPGKARNVEVPAELAELLAADAEASAAFAALTPGRRREYAAHIGAAKREDTRRKRADNALPLIRAGVGLNDKYRK